MSLLGLSKAPDTGRKKVEIKWVPGNPDLAQIYSHGLEYALVSKKKEQCHPFVFCRDFIQDAVFAQVNGKTASIFEFTYDPKKMPQVGTDRLRLVLVNKSDGKFAARVSAAEDFVNQFSTRLKLKPTRVFQVSNPPRRYAGCGAFLFSASGMWLNSPVLLSMYTLLLRVGFIHEVGRDCMKTVEMLVSGEIKPYQSEDKHQLTKSLSGIEKILKLGYRKFFYIDTGKNYPKISTYAAHSLTGIQNFSQGGTKSICPYWNRKSIGKKTVKVDEVPVNPGDLAQ